MIKIMIVDDDKLVRLGIKHSMPWKKYDMQIVAEAENATKALEVLKTTEVDLAFIDIEMPGMIGLELLKQIKQINENIHCVMLTMHQEFTYVQDALRLGVLDYIIKTELSEENFDEVLFRLKQRIEDLSEPKEYAVSKSDYSSEIHNCVLKAVSIIQEDKSIHLSSADIAKKVNMSRSYFCTSFKQITGLSYNDYVKKDKMDYAKVLLCTTNYGVAYIAAQVSYSNEKYFSSVFKSYFGESPTDYRKNRL